MQSAKRRLICLIGIDGIGKTTHSWGLIRHLNQSGVRCKYVWFGNAYFLSYPFMIFCRLLGLTTIHHLAAGLAVSEHEYYKNTAVSKVWPWIQFLDALILVGLRVKRLLSRQSVVVCDRFIPDIMVELMVDVGDNYLHRKLVGSLILRLMPDSTLSVCLDADERIAWKRKRDVPSLEYLSRRRGRYNILSRDLEIPMVNAEGSYVAIQRHVATLTDGIVKETTSQKD